MDESGLLGFTGILVHVDGIVGCGAMSVQEGEQR